MTINYDTCYHLKEGALKEVTLSGRSPICICGGQRRSFLRRWHRISELKDEKELVLLTELGRTFLQSFWVRLGNHAVPLFSGCFKWRSLWDLKMSCPCQMTKEKQFRNEFDVLYSREDSPQIGAVQCLTSSGDSFQGIVGKSEHYRALEEATRK